MTLNRKDEMDNVFAATARQETRRSNRQFARFALIALAVVALLVLLAITARRTAAEMTPAGYQPDRPMMGELYVDGTVRTLTLPSNASSTHFSFYNGSAAHPSTVPVYFTFGTPAAAAPSIATPTAGHPTAVNFIDPNQPYADTGAFKQFSFVTDGTACYVRFTIVY
jgi:hypothetical protein